MTTPTGEKTMASIYDYQTAHDIAAGLQGSAVCDEAIQAARALATDRDEPVVLEDDGDTTLVHPDGSIEDLPSDWAG